MYMVKTTIAATGVAQCAIPKGPVIDDVNKWVQSWVPQNNGTHSMTLGDPSVTTTNGLVLQPSGSVGSLIAFNYPINLYDVWVIGTAGDVLNIMCIP